MNNRKTLALTAGLVLLSVSGAYALRAPANSGPGPLPVGSEAPSIQVLSIQPFALAEATTHFWRAEQPSYERGWLLVLDAPEAWLEPRQTAEPVLYVGAETAERINVGNASGKLVVVVPDLGQADVLADPVFFGDAELPESVTRERAQQQLAAALASGATVLEREGLLQERIVLPDAWELHYFASTLVAEHSPQEIDLIRGLQVERIR